MVYKRGKTFHYDFSIAGQRYRGSTKQPTATAARQWESTLMLKIKERGNRWVSKKSPRLCDFSSEFLDFVGRSSLDQDTKLYYHNGWRLLAQSEIAALPLDAITQEP